MAAAAAAWNKTEIDEASVEALFAPYKELDGVRVVHTDPTLDALRELGKRNVGVCSVRQGGAVTLGDLDAVAAHTRYSPECALVVAWGATVSVPVRAEAEARQIGIVVTEESAAPLETAKAVRRELKDRRRQLGVLDPVWIPYADDDPDGCCVSLWHRPTPRQIGQLASADTDALTHVVCLLANRESPQDIRKACDAHGVAFLRIPMDGAHVLRLNRAAVLVSRRAALLARLLSSAEPSARVLIHCAAGVHRTGVVGFLLGRMAGRGPADALEWIHRIRGVTGRGVGAKRVVIAERMYQTWLATHATAEAVPPPDNPAHILTQDPDAAAVARRAMPATEFLVPPDLAQAMSDGCAGAERAEWDKTTAALDAGETPRVSPVISFDSSRVEIHRGAHAMAAWISHPQTTDTSFGALLDTFERTRVLLDRRDGKHRYCAPKISLAIQGTDGLQGVDSHTCLCVDENGEDVFFDDPRFPVVSTVGALAANPP